MSSLIKRSTRFLFIALLFIGSFTLPFESESIPLSKLKNRILYDKPPVEIVFIGGVPIVYAPERKVIGWQSYCGVALSTCDEDQQMIVLDAVDGVFK